MGANASTAVPVYASGEVLDAARLNLTNAGIPVFADSSARDAAFGGTGEKTLAEGQFAFLEDTNTTQFYDGAVWQPVATTSGVVQVKSAIKTTSFSTASSTFVDVTDVTVNITPTSASNKVLVTVSGLCGQSALDNAALLNLVRTSTNIAQSTGSGTANQSFAFLTVTANEMTGFTITFLDSPATTSATTYKLQTRATAAGTSFIGRWPANDNFRSVTTITVMEVTP